MQMSAFAVALLMADLFSENPHPGKMVGIDNERKPDRRL